MQPHRRFQRVFRTVRTCESPASLAGRLQKGHSRPIHAAAPRAFRQMESTSRDPSLPKLRVATLRGVCLHAVASVVLGDARPRRRNAQCARQVAAGASRASRCRAATSPRAMPASQRDAAAAAAYYRAALARRSEQQELLSARSWRCWPNGEVEEAMRLAERLVQARQERPDRAAGARRAGASSRSNTAPRASISRSRCAGRSPIWPRRCCRPGPYRPDEARSRSRPSTSCRAGLVRAVQGPACRPDPRSRPATEGSRQAPRARPQARPTALRVARPTAAAVAQSATRKRR